MGDWLVGLAAGQGFLPHGYCFQWSPDLLALMVGSDLVVMTSYYSIPLALLAFVRARKDVPFNWVFCLFSAFIFLCGTTHLVDLITIWYPTYWLQAHTKAVTAAVSAATAVSLWLMMPKLLKLPSNAQLRALVAQLEHEVKERRAAEVRLDDLAHQLEGKVLERTAQLEESLAERERLKDVDRAREVAEASNRAKSEFMSAMSHELRTPLNAVGGFAQLMLAEADNGHLARRHAEWARHIRDAGRHLLEMIDGLLDVARIEARGVEVQLESVDLAQTATECEAMLRDAAQAKQVALSVQVSSPQTVAVTDRVRIKQVLTNLVSNGIKYNRPAGAVKAQVQVADGELHIDVADTGLGMTPEQQARLFRPFDRLGRERQGDVHGTGLGLVLVKQIVDALQGRISVESTAGIGTRFRVVLPVGAA